MSSVGLSVSLAIPDPVNRAATGSRAKEAAAHARQAPATLDHAPPFRGAEAASSSAKECLAAAIYYEARSERLDGQRAVAQVVLNRVRHPAFPSTICGVVYQGAERKTGCQFTFTCDGSTRQRRDQAAWKRASEVAEAALQGEVAAHVGFATHYHTDEVKPYWASSLRRLSSLGDHIFYVWRGAAGHPGAFTRTTRVAVQPEP